MPDAAAITGRILQVLAEVERQHVDFATIARRADVGPDNLLPRVAALRTLGFVDVTEDGRRIAGTLLGTRPRRRLVAALADVHADPGAARPPGQALAAVDGPLLSSGSEPSAKVTVTIENTDGESIAPAVPWSVRAAISIPSEVEKPQGSENPANETSPTMNSRLRPSMSPSRPPRRRKPPKVSA